MPSRAISSPAAPSSSAFGHSTPALSRHSGLGTSSSSPPTDVIATPSDRYDAPGRKSHQGKQQPRRSTRIRTSSGGPNLDSSPQVHELSSSAHYGDEFGSNEYQHVHQHHQLVQEMPGRSRAVRTAATPAHALPSSLAGQARVSSRASSSRPSLGHQGSSGYLAQSVSAQYEQVGEPVMDFLAPGGATAAPVYNLAPSFQRTNSQPNMSGGSYGAAASSPVLQAPPAANYAQPGFNHPHQQQPQPQPQMLQLPPRSSVSTTPAHRQHYSHQLPPQPSSAGALQSAFELDAPFSARPSLEAAMTRSAKRQRASDGAAVPAGGSAVLDWAQEGSGSSSSSSDDDDAPMLASLLTSQQRRAGAGVVPAAHSPGRGLLPSGAAGVEASPSTVGRGAMDRYMTDRPSNLAAAPEAAVPLPSTSTASSSLPISQPTASAFLHTTTSLPAIPASPITTRKPLSYPAHALLSPVPSRPSKGPGSATGALFSPDVAKLLRSELDELEANELAGRSSVGSLLGSGRKRTASGSPRKQVDRSSDIVVDDSYSSPYQRNASPFSSGGASHTRDIFSVSQDDGNLASKRSRWTAGLSVQQENGLASPTPSSASLSMRAPSFCDSSPAASDRGSVISRSQPYLHHAIDVASSHPASAPDFLYGGIPSSSPTSSHHSEYLPARYHRSSPGPSTGLGRSETMSSFASDIPTASRAPKRAPTQRTAAMNNNPSGRAPPYGQGDPHTKPTFSYAALIGQALFSVEDRKLALSDIYAWIMKLYPYFKKSDQGWQNSIRHNLSLNPCFVKTIRGPENPGKGCLWAIKEGTEDQFVDGDFVRKGGQPSARRNRGKGKKGGDAVSTPVPVNVPHEPKVDVRTLLRGSDLSASSVGESPIPPLANLAPPPPPSSHGRHSSPASSRGISPALSTSSTRPPLQQRRSSQVAFSPALSAVSTRSTTPALMVSPLPPSVELPVEEELEELPPHPNLTFTMPPPPLAPRPATAAGFQRTESAPHLGAVAMTLRSHSSMGFTEQPHAEPFQQEEMQVEQQEYQHQRQQPMQVEDVKPRFLAAPPISRTHSLPVFPSTQPTMIPTSPPSRSSSFAHLHEPLLSTTMSPPTSVYHRLAGPYQPLSYDATPRQLPHLHRSPGHSHRALALLASPEAGGIMAGHPSDRPALLAIPASSSSSSDGGEGGKAGGPFLPAPQIFPAIGGGAKRRRTESLEKEERALQSMLSPTALVYTQSPISSIRGGPRQPMSPVQNSSAQLEPCPDPEKKSSFGRPTGARLLPAVNALATSSSSSISAHHDNLFDPFRSPPQSGFATPPLPSYAVSTTGKAHLRSPSARLQAALTCSTPGGTKGRFPLGFSPSLAVSAGGGRDVGGAWSVSHPSSSSRSSAAGWEDEYAAVGGAVGGAAGWPNTPGMAMGREW
ncbi:hypothetical protein JCM8547_004970 [Rhodosporidiobolus lusitaniae]